MQYVMQHILSMQLLVKRRFFVLTLALTAISFGLIGCGNKGPLYLPPEVVQEVSSPTALDTEATSEDNESSESEETETMPETETNETE